MRRTQAYQVGYADGCAAANAAGSSYRYGPVRNEDAFRSNKALSRRLEHGLFGLPRAPSRRRARDPRTPIPEPSPGHYFARGAWSAQRERVMIRFLLSLPLILIVLVLGGHLFGYGEVEPCRVLAVERARRATIPLPFAGGIEAVDRGSEPARCRRRTARAAFSTPGASGSSATEHRPGTPNFPVFS